MTWLSRVGDGIGGLGLFLLGMWLMTEGLKLAAGQALQHILSTWTQTRRRALASGALITARVATEDHGRDVMALPGRVDSAASEGSLDLIKSGGAALVTCHTDVLDLLESPARFLHAGVHDARYAPAEVDPDGPAMFEAPPKPVAALPLDLTETQRRIVEALSEPRSIDDLARATGLEASRLLADATVLEIRRVVVRSGSMLTRRGRG